MRGKHAERLTETGYYTLKTCFVQLRFGRLQEAHLNTFLLHRPTVSSSC